MTRAVRVIQTAQTKHTLSNEDAAHLQDTYEVS